jgi:hypothetical protein
MCDRKGCLGRQKAILLRFQPYLQMTSFVAVVIIAPGVQAESGRAPWTIHPEVLVRSPHCGCVAVVVEEVDVAPGVLALQEEENEQG